MPPLVGTRLPPSARHRAAEPIAIAQTTNASGAYGPMEADRAAGTTKMPAPMMALKRLAAKARGPTERSNPLSRWFSVTRSTAGRGSGRRPLVAALSCTLRGTSCVAPGGSIMLRGLSIPFCLALSVGAHAQGTAPAAPGPSSHAIVIRAQSLIDGTSAQARHGEDILIRGNRIVEVYPTGAHAPPADAQLIDLASETVLPGLIDSHTHIFLQGEVPEAGGYDIQLLKFPASYRVARAIVAARRALEQGFTTIRDVETEGAGYGDVGIKRAINEGYIPGPRMFVATRAISSTGGYSLDDYAPEITVPKGAQIIDGPIEARKAAREQLDNGADWIKVYMTHRSWLDEHGDLVSQPTLTVEELKAVVDEAHGWRRKVACHAYNGPGLQRALDGGCDSIEHGLELTDAQIAQMIRQGTWYVPTLSVYYYDPDPEDTPSGKRDRKRVALHGVSFQKALRAGVKIAFGTDVGGF